MVKIIVFLFVVGCGGWSRRDTALESAFLFEQAIDMRQTDAALADRYMHEANPIIGDHGQNMSPAAYFLTTSLLHVAVSAVLPQKWRTGWQLATGAWQGYNIVGNHLTFEQVRETRAEAAGRR